MRPLSRVLGPKGMRLGGCQSPKEMVRSAKMSAEGRRLIAAAGRKASSCSIIVVSGVPSPPGVRKAHRTASFFNSPMLLLILQRLADHKENRAVDVQKALAKMREEVKRASC